MSYMDELNFWLNDDYFDQKTKEELLAIRNNEAEVEDRFYKELEFGTGGLRGVIGAGTNRMNVYTVRKATQGLANYIIRFLTWSFWRFKQPYQSNRKCQKSKTATFLQSFSYYT